MKFKKITLTFSLIFVTFVSIADEGMWLPQLLNALTIKDMQKNGCKLTAIQTYAKQIRNQPLLLKKATQKSNELQIPLDSAIRLDAMKMSGVK